MAVSFVVEETGVAGENQRPAFKMFGSHDIAVKLAYFYLKLCEKKVKGSSSLKNDFPELTPELIIH